jgi:hypothetical protein
MVWQRGQSGNPRGGWEKGTSGNPKGAQPGREQNQNHKNKRGNALPVGVGSRGGKTEWKPAVVGEGEHIDPLDYQQSVIDNPSIPLRDRLQASALLAPFKHVKPQGQYLSRCIEFEPPATIPEALELRRKFMAMKYRCELTVEEADRLTADIDAQIAVMRGPDHEQRLRALEEARARGENTSAVSYIVEGGLPMMQMGMNRDGVPWQPILMPEHVRTIEAPVPLEEKPNDNSTFGTRPEDSDAGTGSGSQDGTDKD